MFDVGRFFPAVGAGAGFGGRIAQMAWLRCHGAAGFTGVSHNSSSTSYLYAQNKVQKAFVKRLNEEWRHIISEQQCPAAILHL
jgi:hypothetical protein